ncbi:MAG: hypothetical protein H6712_28885 [Myxococcales bacterium]|nr:hypothetical protein [Myxococcales bacterium]MCB9717899.1 hypothetical protein [Myxococcales bacterium]
MVGLLACEPPGVGPATNPPRVPGSSGPALNVPYPIAEPERIEGAGRRSLAEASFVHVSLGGPPEAGDHHLPERIASDGPVLVSHFVGPQLRSWTTLRRLAFGRVEPPRGRAVVVDPEELEALELRPPAAAVWLVGPRGTCRASVGAPVVGAYDDLDVLMVGYRLEGCPGRAWAQVGIVADTIPVDFRWVPARAAPEQVLSYGKVGDDPVAPLLPPPQWAREDPPRFELLQLREIPGAEPRMLQAHRAWLSAVPPEGDRAWCEVEVAWTRTDGFFNGRWVDPVPFTAEAVGPFMLGAFVNGPQVDAVIYDDHLDALIIVPPGPLDDMDDTGAWTQVFVTTGPYDDAELDAWGVDPARGPLPVGPSCEPVVDATAP